MRFIYLLLLSSFLFLHQSCIKDNINIPEEKIDINDLLPFFKVDMSDGSIITSESFKNKVGVLFFFHTDCNDCKRTLPHIQRTFELYGNNDNLIFVGISREESDQEISKYWADNNYTIPYSAQEDRKVYELFAKQGIPRIYIIDQDCYVRFSFDDNDILDCNALSDKIDYLLRD